MQMTIEELKKLPLWVNWKYQDRGSGKKTKVPVNAKTGGNAKSDLPETWCTYTTADWKKKKNNCNGVGVMFSGLGNGYMLCGVDIDNHAHTVGGNPLQPEILELFRGTYAEKSPSGNGCHILFMLSEDFIEQLKKVWEKYNNKKSDEDIECYISGITNRYFTYTGDIIADYPITDMSAALQTFLDKYMLREQPQPQAQSKPVSPVPAPAVLDIAAMLDIARNSKSGAAFCGLYDGGDTSAYNGDDSSADLALCQMLAFYLQGDYNKIDIAFRSSALMRSKWEREDYRSATINKAIKSCRKFYTPPQPKVKAEKPKPQPIEGMPPFILGMGKDRVLSCTALADYIRAKLPYFFIRKAGSESYRRYVYHKGVYNLVSDTEFKGFIKAIIAKADPDLVRMKDVNETFLLLTTDLDRCRVREEQLNADENLINFKNGILHLDTMELTPHTPQILSTIQLPITYTGEEETPLFDRFMQEFTCGNAEKKQTLLEFMGACISNVYGYRFKQALFCVGEGNSGKSVLREFVNRLLGADNISGGGLELLESRFGKLNLYGKRVYGSPDIGYVTLNQLETFKNITGGDTIPIESKGKDAFEYQYRGLVWFGGNAMPKFGGDRGDWVYNRMLLIMCNNVIPPEKRNKHLVEDLLTESSGIVYKALTALKQAIARGYMFTVPAESQQLLEKYKVDNSPYLRFYNECCVARPSKWGKRFDSVTCAKLHQALKKWCADNTGGLNSKPQDLVDELSRNGIDTSIAISSGYRYYDAFTLSPEFKETYGFFDNAVD